MTHSERSHTSSKWVEVALVFLKLGLISFGGPAAHIGLFHDELVKRRKWLDDHTFLDLLGAVNIIPGPNSTEMVIHIGWLRAGWAGFLASGTAFILPAFLFVLTMAWGYVRFGETLHVEEILVGVKPVILVIVLQAIVKLVKTALHDRWTVGVAVAAAALSLFGFHPLGILLLSGLAVMLLRHRKVAANSKVMGWFSTPFIGLIPTVLAVQPYNLLLLFLTFLKTGAVLYGSGYVLLAFLRADFVVGLGWLTDQQLLEAVTIGQVTPGPLFTTATFIGYILGGVPGAIAATVGIFLPSFILVALSRSWIPRLRSSPLTSALLDGVNAASLGLMASVLLELGRAALTGWVGIIVGIVSAILILYYKINSTWMIAAGLIVGILLLLI